MKTPEQTNPTGQQTESSQSSESVFDLTEHLKANGNTAAPPPTSEPTDEPEPDTTTAPETPHFEDIERESINTLLNPDMIAEGLADITDLARQMLYPTVYERIMFKPNEQTLLKAAVNNPESVHPNTYKAITDKLEEFNQHVKKIEWSTGEKLQMVKHIFRPLADKLGPDSAITKYYPLLMVAAIEGKRFKAVANSNTPLLAEVAPPKQERAPAPPPPQPETTHEENEPIEEEKFIDLEQFDA